MSPNFCFPKQSTTRPPPRSPYGRAASSSASEFGHSISGWRSFSKARDFKSGGPPWLPSASHAVLFEGSEKSEDKFRKSPENFFHRRAVLGLGGKELFPSFKKSKRSDGPSSRKAEETFVSRGHVVLFSPSSPENFFQRGGEDHVPPRKLSSPETLVIKSWRSSGSSVAPPPSPRKLCLLVKLRRCC